MKAYVARNGPCGEEELWTGTLEAAPRPDDVLSVNDASFVVDRVEWDCMQPEAELKVFVK